MDTYHDDCHIVTRVRSPCRSPRDGQLAFRRAMSVAGLIAFFGCGCGSGSERVSYDKPAEGPVARNLTVPDSNAANHEAQPVTLSVLGQLKTEEVVAFSGRIRPPDPEKPGLIYITFSSTGRDGKPITEANKIVQTEKGEDGWLTYRVELKAPATANRQRIEITYISPTQQRFLIAAGDADMQ